MKYVACTLILLVFSFAGIAAAREVARRKPVRLWCWRRRVIFVGYLLVAVGGSGLAAGHAFDMRRVADFGNGLFCLALLLVPCSLQWFNTNAAAKFVRNATFLAIGVASMYAAFTP